MYASIKKEVSKFTLYIFCKYFGCGGEGQGRVVLKLIISLIMTVTHT